MVLPKTVRDVLRQNSPRKTIHSGFFLNNRFSSLRDNSPASRDRSLSRHRSISTKRKLNEYPSYADIVSNVPNQIHADEVATAIENCSTEVAKVLSISLSLSESVSNIDQDNPLKTILTTLSEAISGIGRAQESLVDLVSKNRLSTPQYSGPSFGRQDSSTGGNYKKARTNTSMVDLSKLPESSGPSNPSKEEHPEKKKFREAVKEAEKSTLVFNLDMGKFPIMNQEAMNAKATLALTSMAASKEKNNSSNPSDEAAEAIEDALSLVKGVKFYGNTTKTYRNPHDKEKSGSFCTVPVRYDFKDRDTRARAEKVLRDRCGINSSVPYHPILRDCIKQTITHFKEEFPRDFIRVNVDATNFALKVSRKPEGSPSWLPYRGTVSLPPEALDTTARKIPEGVTVTINSPPESPGRLSRKDSHDNQKAASPQRENS